MSQVDLVRRFNRTVIQRIGALSARYLDRRRSLAEARLLFEIGPTGAEVRNLRTTLGVDSGYLSRLLRALERDGFVESAPASHDGRVRHVKLTKAGRAELRVINRRSDQVAKSLLAPLSELQRERLLTAMDEVERLLWISSIVIESVNPTGGDARFCLAEYFKELHMRFEDGYDSASAAPTGVNEFVPPNGVFLIARAMGQPIACGGIRTIQSGVGEIKRVWVAPGARGRGVARRIVKTLEGNARAMGLRIIRLDTNRSLTEARALYRSSGYQEIPRYNKDPYAHHWFEKRLRAAPKKPV